uniref:Uncharacterized protein n=1 Tax=Lactuca sativa TaxID=4236 RepID=A0A9R1WBN3_LACSA|nr:hypothetical protein LSAT_V11C200052870 [Lactuca sativa]
MCVICICVSLILFYVYECAAAGTTSIVDVFLVELSLFVVIFNDHMDINTIITSKNIFNCLKSNNLIKKINNFCYTIYYGNIKV